MLFDDFEGTKICRLCLRSDKNWTHIFNNTEVDSKKTLQDYIEKVCGISVTPSDNLPNAICIKCNELLEKSYNFQILARRNDEYLHRILEDNYIEEVKNNEEHIDDQIIQVGEEDEDNNIVERSSNNNSVNKMQKVNGFPSMPNLIGIQDEIDTRDYFESDELILMEDKFRYQGKSQEKKVISSNTLRNNASIKQYKCQFCDVQFTYLKNKWQHEHRHFNPGNLKCSICERTFFTNYDLRRHIRTHTQEKCFECSICGRKFITKAELNRHIKIHDSVRQYTCEECGKDFNSIAVLNFHVRTVHFKEKKHQCENCGKYFITPSKVRRHQKSKICTPGKFATTIHKTNEVIFLGDIIENMCEIKTEVLF